MNSSKDQTLTRPFISLRTRVIFALVIFLLAFGVRVLCWNHTRAEVGKVQTGVTADYKRIANLLRQEGIAAFVSRTSSLSDPNNLGHPPGYPMLMSAFRDSDAAIQFVQITCDALSAVMIFLIVIEFFPLSAALIAGILAAFSPQFAWNSVLLLPDSLAVLPILLAIYCLARATKNPRLFHFIIAGAFVGVSCWLRANALLLTFFLAAATWLLFARQRPWRYSLAVIAGTILLVAPLTIRNAIVFHRFIPLSLGAGQTLLEGIADYDRPMRFGIPNTDVGIMKLEADEAQRPDYNRALFNPDGVEREHSRLTRGFAVIRAHPFWFAGVMTRRAASMLKLERTHLVALGPPADHGLTRYPYFLVHAVQKIFLTAVMLPLALVGFGLIILRKQRAALIILTVVPVYFFCVQSVFHTEYRYFLALDYFLFALAGITVSWLGNLFIAQVVSRRARVQSTR
jgi:4-amino-4-deoxy-L-arabinose transferase-like glycosyltransferase